MYIVSDVTYIAEIWNFGRVDFCFSVGPTTCKYITGMVWFGESSPNGPTFEFLFRLVSYPLVI